MNVRESKQIPLTGVEKILIRGTNWIGDAVMTFPALAAIRSTYPGAWISLLAKPWVADLYRLSPDIDNVMLLQSPGFHAGVIGKFRLASELKQNGFHMAILLQNAIEAAIIACLARIPIRAGYNSDGRGFLLTHSVQRTEEIRKVHQVDYYREMVQSLGCRDAGRALRLRPGNDYAALADGILASYGIAGQRPLIGIAPGATYGPAKKWYPERFAAVADRLIDDLVGQVLLFGSAADRDSTGAVKRNAMHNLINLAGKTGLKEAIALISRCDLFISNDSGLMHVAAALGIPTVAIFGSTNAVTTSPIGEKIVIVRKNIECSPCLRETCPGDFKCMDMITVSDVAAAAKGLLCGR
ncbi:MAG: lipopolysaccharide heptosyltransferase II [Deltaproteobacteria bacterium]|nr:lipopolysaccharide heptosyltransferase II [Deltaproteobacteria bacterium]